MSLAVGLRVGAYEVTGPLGEGGMGQVWQARDVRLGRDVAIKVLPDAFAQDPERLARFERESQALAALNHPHIAIIHGTEDTGTGRAIIMECIPGPTLEQRLAHGPLPLAEVYELGRDLASALEAAHDHGVVHRDLKPANVKFTADGRLKILDFGLAKTDVTEPAPAVSSDSTGMAARAGTTSGAGRVVGTAAYMSPEQARGAAVDRRTDIWAFGCVLYEMLSGRRPFTGESVTDVLAQVVTADPDWSALPAATPRALRTLVERCLRKDLRRRLRDAGDARLVFEDLVEGREPASPAPSPARPAHARVHAAWALAALAALGAGVAIGWQVFDGAMLPPLRKLEVTVHDPVIDVFTRPRIAPDGHAIVYGAGDRLWVRRLDALDAQPLPQSAGAEAPFWSHDSRTVAFARNRRLWRVPAEGGEPVAICDLPARGRIIAGAWREDDAIVFAAWQGPLYQVSARGGDPSVLLPLDPQREVDFHELAALPGNRGVLFVRHEKGGELQHIEVLAGDRRAIVLQAHGGMRFDNPRYAPPGYLVYERLDSNAGIWAAPFSLDTLTVTGESARIAPSASLPGVSADGTLIYVEETGSYQLTWVNRAGERLGIVGTPQLELLYPAISPDGTRVAVSAADPDNIQDRDVWVYDVASGTRARLHGTPTPTRDLFAAWSPDGRTIFYSQHRREPATLVAASLDYGESPNELTAANGRVSVSRDGRSAVYSRANAQDVLELWWAEIDAGLTRIRPQPLLRAARHLTTPRLSPDARFIAYTSEETGIPEVLLRRFPAGDERWRVSTDGGESPAWNGAGTELYYRAAHGAIMAVPVTLGDKVLVGAPRALFDDQTSRSRTIRGWDVTPDGQRFLVLTLSDSGRLGQIVVVQQWLSEFSR
jgi:eukaryotic-like serine/threonine-protein kinase